MQLLSNAAPLTQPTVAGALLFAVAGPTVFAFCAMSFSSKKVKPSINASYTTLQPVLVAVLSLLLFGTALDSAECAAGALVIAGLGMTVVGSPKIDREWAAYVSDLPANVPQTIASVADASLSAAVTASETVSDRIEGVRADVGDRLEGVLDDFVSSTAAEESSGAVAVQRVAAERLLENLQDRDGGVGAGAGARHRSD